MIKTVVVESSKIDIKDIRSYQTRSTSLLDYAYARPPDTLRGSIQIHWNIRNTFE